MRTFFKLSENREDKVNETNALSLTDMPREIIQYVGSFIKHKKNRTNYGSTCKTVYNFFQSTLDLEQLLQAVIDDDIETVKKILDAKPELLLQEPQINEGVESRKTLQKFNAKPFKVAIKRRQLEMVSLMLPYFSKLENGKQHALTQWFALNVSQEEKTQYEFKIKTLIEIIAKETFPYSPKKTGSISDKLIASTSNKTKWALETFRKELLPDGIITLENYPDVEQLFIAAYKVYSEHRDVLRAQHEDLYGIFVFNVMKSVLIPEYDNFRKYPINMGRNYISIKNHIDQKQIYFDHLKEMLNRNIYPYKNNIILAQRIKK